MGTLYEIEHKLAALTEVIALRSEGLPLVDIASESAEYSAILLAVQTEDGQDIDPDKATAWLDSLYTDRESKIARVAEYIKDLTAGMAAIKSEQDRLTKLLKSRQRKIDWLTGLLDGTLQGQEWRAANGSVNCKYRRSEAVEVYDEALLPAEFLRVKTETAPNKIAIKAAIKGGAEVAGARVEERWILKIV